MYRLYNGIFINLELTSYFSFFQVDTGKIVWPSWIEITTQFSHLLTVFNSSVNFYIYFAKHWRSILGIQESASQPTEAITLRHLDGASSARYAKF